MTPIVITGIGGRCPCQAHGTFYGNPFYFRARHGEWTIEVARPGKDPVSNPELFYMEGEDPDDGYMDTPDAMKQIGKAFDEFTKKYSHQLYYGKAWPDTSLPNPRVDRAGVADPIQAQTTTSAGSESNDLLGG